MLCLSRKLGERIYIDTPQGVRIEVVVVDIERGKIRLGIIAPRDHSIWRQELLPMPPPAAGEGGELS